MLDEKKAKVDKSSPIRILNPQSSETMLHKPDSVSAEATTRAWESDIGCSSGRFPKGRIK
jgi:hypothetical protein